MSLSGNRFMCRCLIYAGLAWLALSGVARAGDPGVSDRQILLGQSAAFSGPAAQLGIQMHAGAKAYFDFINRHGGVHGRQIEIVTADDKYEADLAEQNTRRLIEKNGVFALFGYVGTPTSNAALPLVLKEHIPFFAPFTGAQSLREPLKREIFNIRASYYDETEHLVDQLSKLGIKSIAVFYQNDAYGKTGLDGVERAMKKRGLAIVDTATVERNSTDVAAAVKKLNARKPDAIIQITAYASAAAYIKEMRKNGYTGQFYNVSFVGSQALADVLGNDGPGVVISQVVPFPWDLSIPLVSEYTKILKEAGIDKPNFSSLEGFIAAKVFVEGLRRAGPHPTREKLIAALETINRSNFDIGFDVRFSPTSHSGSMFVEMTAITKGARFMH
jgi:ABC-type branched-subunit amino acid transport system substrate-binding protein